MSAPLVGQLIGGRYRVTRLLGEGGMGMVYEAEETSLGKRVALKILHRYLARDTEAVARFYREARVVSTLGHANIVSISDLGTMEDGSAYMVLEYLDGRDWAEELEASGPQPVASLIHVLAQVCDGLSAAHAAGVVHRDLKPANIFLVPKAAGTFQVKILDFGISKFASDDQKLTATRSTLGTVPYMSPEQVRASPDVDHRSDIYTLGVIAFFALTGELPFQDESLALLGVKILKDAPPRLRDLRADVPAELDKLIRRTLAKNPDKRPQSAAELRADLLPFANIASTAHMRPIRSRREPPSALKMSAAVGAALLLVTGIMLWASSDDPVPEEPLEAPVETVAHPVAVPQQVAQPGPEPEQDAGPAEVTPEPGLDITPMTATMRPWMRRNMRPRSTMNTGMTGRSGTMLSVDDF